MGVPVAMHDKTDKNCLLFTFFFSLEVASSTIFECWREFYTDIYFIAVLNQT